MIINQTQFDSIRDWSKGQESFQNILRLMQETTKNSGFLILHLDDDSVYLDAVAHYLKCAGFRAVSLSKPQDALDYCEALAPALIIVDYYMPEMTGTTFYAALKTKPQMQKTPTLFLTSAQDERTRQSQVETGVSFLSKDLTPDQLVAKFSEHLRAS